MSVQTENQISGTDWIAEHFKADPATPMSETRRMPDARQESRGHPYIALMFKMGAIATAVSLAAGGVGYILYTEGFAAGAMPHAVGKQTILEPGKATVTFVDEHPLQSVILTNYVADLPKGHGVQVGYVEKATGLLSWLTLDDETLVRDAVVDDQLTFDPGKVTITYVPKDNHLTYSIPGSSLSTNVYIQPGTDITEPASQTGSFMDLPEQELALFAKDSAGTAQQIMKNHNLTAAQVPILGGIAAGTTSVQSGMERFADLDIVTQTDQVCTPKLFKEVKGLKTAIDQNMKTSVQGLIYESPFREKLGAFLSQSPTRIAEALANATVKTPDYKFGPDAQNVSALKQYTDETGAFTSTLNESQIDCKIDNNVTSPDTSTGGSQ